MRSRHGRLWLYNAVLLVLVALCLWWAPPWRAEWPAPGVVIGFFALQLLVWHYGFPVPSMGMLSMERVPQIAAICLFPPPVAAVMNGLPALLWPFLNERYRQGSLRYGLIRAIHNACMLGLMTAAAGAVYAALGGEQPLHRLDLSSALALLGAAVVLQVLNSAMMATFFHLDGRDLRRILTWSYLTVDELFVPIGVLAALIYSNTDTVTLVLFAAFVLITVMSLHGLVLSREKVQSRLAALDAASSARQAMSGSRRLDQLGERLLSRIGAMLQFRVALIALHDATRAEFDVLVELVDDERRPRCRKPASEGLTGFVARTGRTVLVDDWSRADPEILRHAIVAPGENPGSVLMVPIRQGDDVLGVISVQHAQAGQYSDADKHALLAIAGDLAPLISDARTFQELDEYRQRLEDLVRERTVEIERGATERERLLEELRSKSELLQRQSREDALTGLANRRHFDERLAQEIARAGRYHHPLALVLLDIDHFKRVNDTAGHGTGDAVLIRAAELLRGRMRQSDLVARIGGEEFALLLSDSDLAAAAHAAEQVRQALEQTGFDDLHPGLRPTLSAGVAVWQPGEDRDALLRRADRALYAAKHAGRNRVAVA